MQAGPGDVVDYPDSEDYAAGLRQAGEDRHGHGRGELRRQPVAAPTTSGAAVWRSASAVTTSM